MSATAASRTHSLHSFIGTDAYVVDAHRKVFGYDLKIPSLPHLQLSKGFSVEQQRKIASLNIAAATLEQAEPMVAKAQTVPEAIGNLTQTQALFKADVVKTKTIGHRHNDENPRFGSYPIKNTPFEPPMIPQVLALDVGSGSPHYLIDETDRRIISVQTAAETLRRAAQMIQTAASVTEAITLIQNAELKMTSAAEEK